MQTNTVRKFRDLPAVHRSFAGALIFGLFPFWLVALIAYEFCLGIRRAIRDTWNEAAGACAEVKEFWRATRS